MFFTIGKEMFDANGNRRRSAEKFRKNPEAYKRWRGNRHYKAGKTRGNTETAVSVPKTTNQSITLGQTELARSARHETKRRSGPESR
jgi:hypothetical protein